MKQDAIRDYANLLIEQYDVRSGQGPITVVRSMSGGNQQKAIIAREVDRDKPLIVAVQPTRGLDVGAIEYIHSQLVAERDKGKAILLVSLELDEVMNLSDRILVLYEGEIVGNWIPRKTTDTGARSVYGYVPNELRKEAGTHEQAALSFTEKGRDPVHPGLHSLDYHWPDGGLHHHLDCRPHQ